MGFWIYRKIRKLLQTKPVQLWGISLLAGLLVWLAAIGFYRMGTGNCFKFVLTQKGK